MWRLAVTQIPVKSTMYLLKEPTKVIMIMLSSNVKLNLIIYTLKSGSKIMEKKNIYGKEENL